MAFVATALFMSALFVLANALPELEPNNTQNTAQTIQLQDTIIGNIPNAIDQDWYKLTLQQGTYILRIDYPAGPSVRDWFNLFTASGQPITHMCYYPGANVHLVYFKVCNPSQDVFLQILANADFGLSNADYHIDFQLDQEDLFECNDDITSARIIAAPSVVPGKIPLADDVDVLKINALSGVFAMSANTPQQPNLLFNLALYQGNNPVPIATTIAGHDLNFNLPTDGIYYVSIDYANDTMSMFPYAASLLYVANLSCGLSLDTALISTSMSICGQSTGSISIPQPEDGVVPFNYALNGGTPQSSATFSNLAEGSYEIVVTDANGCTAEVSVEITCIACGQPAIGINNAFVTGKSVQLALVQQNVDSISINYGDGTVSESPAHTYTNNGEYTVIVSAFNDCGSSTAITTVSIRSAAFRVGWVDHVVAGDTVKIPIIVEEGNYQWAGVSGGVVFSNPAVGDFIKIESGTLHASQMQYGNNNNLFAGVGNAQANESFEVGDTIFYICVIATGDPGDSTEVNIPDFNFSIFINNGLQELFTTITPGGFSMVHDVELRIKVKTPSFLPIPGVKVEVESPDTIIHVVTDNNGMVTLLAPYSQEYKIRCEKDTVVTAGINTIDPFLIIRMLVQLFNVGLTPYSYVAADFDCSGTISINDPSSILNFIVGNIDAPCQQYVFIPSYHVFGAYPSSGYFNFPTEFEILNSNPVLGEDVNMVGVIRGDVNHSSIPQLTASPEDRSNHESTWKYSIEDNGDFQSIWLSAEDIRLSGGFLNLNFNAADFSFVQAMFVQGSYSNSLVVNERFSSAGNLRIAFINQSGKALDFDTSLPLLQFIFKKKNAGTGAELSLSLNSNSAPSVLADAFGESYELLLERYEPLSGEIAGSFKVFPNPAKDIISINLPGREVAKIDIFNLTGELIYTYETRDDFQVQVPVSDFAEGVYVCRVIYTGKTFTQKVEVIK